MLEFTINVLCLKDPFNLGFLSLELKEALEHMTKSFLSIVACPLAGLFSANV